MNRIAAGVLITGAVLAMGQLSLRPALAQEMAPKVVTVRSAEAPQVLETRGGSRVMALVVALRALQTEAKR